jgi:restriction endonuclease S subunit
MIEPLSALADIQSGHPFRGSVAPVPGGNAYALQMRDISPDGEVAWSGVVQTRIEGRRAPEWLQPGDVVFVTRGARNFALCLREVPLPAVCSQYFFLLRAKKPKRLLPEFLAWQINGAPAQRYLASNAEGSDQLSIRRGVLENLPMVLPAVEEQRRIVALAAAALREKKVLEALIQNRQRQLDALACRLHAR